MVARIRDLRSLRPWPFKRRERWTGRSGIGVNVGPGVGADHHSTVARTNAVVLKSPWPLALSPDRLTEHEKDKGQQLYEHCHSDCCGTEVSIDTPTPFPTADTDDC
jgi:hypothetical protein